VEKGDNENTLQLKVRQAGGQWDPGKRLWKLPHKHVVELGLEERMVVA